jgi:hypothetical protein
MPRTDAAAGWHWFEPQEAIAEAADDLARSAAACLQTPQGRHLLHLLERCFLERRVPPSASDAELRHAEGQRTVVSHLLRLVERGQQAPASPHSSVPATGVSP